jgi:hypothetical protein
MQRQPPETALENPQNHSSSDAGAGLLSKKEQPSLWLSCLSTESRSAEGQSGARRGAHPGLGWGQDTVGPEQGLLDTGAHAT